ncbi:glyoxylate/hydroxypyruvate reductase B-like [Gastrophryne carolinensis]
MQEAKELPYILVEDIGGSYGVMEEHLNYLKERFTLITLKDLKEKKEVAEKIVCIFNWANKPDVDSTLLKCLPRLKVIASAGAGVDHLDLKMIASYGVKVANTPYAVTSSTADLAMMLLLVSARSFLEGHKIATSPNTDYFHGNWVSQGDITGTTLGIVGMGRIGYKIAQRAKAFEMKILYHNRHRRPEEEKSVGATYCENLADLLQHSDYVMIVVNLCPQTEKLMGKKEFKLMKPSATLINVSRGPVVDQDALVEALQTGEIKSAALDVTYPEPLPRDHPLLKLSNVIITPHMGTATRDALRAMMEDMVLSMTDATTGRPVSFEVTKN